jgi:hypothetical protein
LYVPNAFTWLKFSKLSTMLLLKAILNSIRPWN